ncbi:MAG: hypothetical protein Q8R25_03055 [bacterium]|nr:hypothetical protein [bacterium]
MHRNTHNIFIGVVASALAFLPLLVFAQSSVQYPAGVSTCERSGSAGLSASVGSFFPIGGPYVPVVDYAVELNTATLVYKECVLREIVNQQRKAAAALIVKDLSNKFMTQRNGGPMFPVSLDRDILIRQDATKARVLKDGTLSTINSSFQNLVKGAIALNWRVNTRAPNNALACPYQGDIDTQLSGRDFSFAGLWAEGDPRCRPLDNYYLARDLTDTYVALDSQEMMFRLMTSNGIYGNESVDENGNRVTDTPGIFVGANMEQAVQSGFRQLENADDIGEIVDALFASMADQVITSGPGGTNGLSSTPGGLMGMTQSITGSNYFDQVLRSQLGDLSGTITSGILATLKNLLANEKLYNQTVTHIGQLVQKAQADLQSAEKKCFASTSHSDAAINNSLAPIVTDIAPKIKDSSDAIKGLEALITSLDSGSPPSTQEITATLRTLKLHSQQQTQAEQNRSQTLTSDLAQFVQDTIAAWQSEPSAAVGCGAI